MRMMLAHAPRMLNGTAATALILLLSACGGGGSDSGSNAAQPGASSGQKESAPAGDSGRGPDLSQLGQIVLGKINEDPTRMEMKVTGTLVEFTVVSAETEFFGDEAAAAVVECAGVVVFDGDVHWSWKDTEPKKAGEPANFECKAEYHNQDNGWQLAGPMGIYPL